MPNHIADRLNLVVDQRSFQTPDGAVWSHSSPDYSFMQELLEVFDEIRLVARAAPIAEPPAHARRVDGPGVKLIPVPSYIGPFQYLVQCRAVSAEIARISQLDGAFLLRIPSQIAFLLANHLDVMRRPYAVELLTDPHAFFAPGVAPHGLASLFRPYFCRRSRQLCERAVAANFVTGQKTRQSHPTPLAEWVGSWSDVDLPPDAFLPPRPPNLTGPIRVISVGFFDLLYKGQDLLIRALGRCHRQGLDFTLTLAGSGEMGDRLLDLAARNGISDRVTLTGPLAGPAAVRAKLVESDLFVLPSRAEGIPRALLEAMAARLPAIGSDVGAMPDLLPARWIVPVGDEYALEQSILEFASDRGSWSAIGDQNQFAVRSLERSSLRLHRREFYEAIRLACHSQSLSEVLHSAA